MTSIDPINSVLELKGRQVWSVAPTTVVFEAIRTMSNKGVGALLVMSEASSMASYPNGTTRER